MQPATLTVLLRRWEERCCGCSCRWYAAPCANEEGAASGAASDDCAKEEHAAPEQKEEGAGRSRDGVCLIVE